MRFSLTAGSRTARPEENPFSRASSCLCEEYTVISHLFYICILHLTGWAKGKADECLKPKPLSWEDVGINAPLALQSVISLGKRY